MRRHRKVARRSRAEPYAVLVGFLTLASNTPYIEATNFSVS